MNNILRKLKSVLEGLSDEELDNFGLWIDNEDEIQMIAIDENAISLITNTKKLKNRWRGLVKEKNGIDRRGKKSY